MLMNVVVVYLMILISLNSGQEEAGSQCNSTLTKQKGICTAIDKCPQARDDLKHKRIPQICSLEEKVITVCCLKNVSSISKSPSSPVTIESKTFPSYRVPGVRSKEKCREFSKHIFVKRAPVLIVDVDRYMRNVCDLRVDLRNSRSGTARRNEFPHMALVGFVTKAGDIDWICGGSLISKQYVLTAAQCFYSSQYGEPDYVKVGITNRRKDTLHLQQFKIIEMIPHPENDGIFNDIGLLKLERPIEITPYAGPACLYTEHNITFDEVVATGWGNILYDGDIDDNLHKVVMNITSAKICSKMYSEHRITDVMMFCAVPTDEIDVCQGDAGGPLQIYHLEDDAECMYDIVGIVSFGKGCGEPNMPGVNTRVSNYVKWIEDIVWP